MFMSMCTFRVLALEDPVTTIATTAALFMTGKVRVTRFKGGLGESPINSIHLLFACGHYRERKMTLVYDDEF